MAATRRLMTGVLGAGLMAWWVAAAAASDDTAAFHIEAGELSTTLKEWSYQAQVQILFNYTSIVGRPSAALDCECTLRESLVRLLAGSGAVFDFMNERTVAVVVEEPPQATSQDITRWMRRFEYVAQVYAEGAGPAVAPLRVTWGEDKKLIAAQR